MPGLRQDNFSIRKKEIPVKMILKMLKTFEKITSFYWIMGRICAMLKWIAIAGPYRVFSAFIHRLKRVKTDKEKARESL